MDTKHNSIGTALTLFDPLDDTILAELSDANWAEESPKDAPNYVMSGNASDGSLDALSLFMERGQDTVKFEFVRDGFAYGGKAFLLRPDKIGERGTTRVRIETPQKPVLVQ